MVVKGERVAQIVVDAAQTEALTEFHVTALQTAVVGEFVQADGPLPMRQDRRRVDGEIVVEVVDGLREIVGGGVGDGALQKQCESCRNIARGTDGTAERVNDGENRFRLGFVECSGAANDENRAQGLVFAVELLECVVDDLECVETAATGHQREREHRQQVGLHLAVLDASAIVVLVFGRRHFIVDNNPLVVFLDIDIAQLAHFAQFVLAPPLLNALMLVDLGFGDAKFVLFGLRRHSEATIALRPRQQSSPEVREGLDDTRIVDDGGAIVARAVEQQGTVVERLQVVGLVAQHEIKVFDGAVVVAELLAQQTAIVVRQEVVRVHIDGHIVVVHRLAQPIPIDAHHRTIHIMIDDSRLVVNRLRESRVGHCPVFPLHIQSRQNRPRIAVVGIALQRAVEPL